MSCKVGAPASDAKRRLRRGQFSGPQRTTPWRSWEQSFSNLRLDHEISIARLLDVFTLGVKTIAEEELHDGHRHDPDCAPRDGLRTRAGRSRSLRGRHPEQVW